MPNGMPIRRDLLECQGAMLPPERIRVAYVMRVRLGLENLNVVTTDAPLASEPAGPITCTYGLFSGATRTVIPV